MTDPRLAPHRGPALAFALYLLVSAASGAILFLLKLGARTQGVAEFYLGSEARFAAPKTLGGILEVALPHLVALPLVLFAASHVVGFARAVAPRAFSWLVGLSFGSALAGVAAGFGVRFFSPGMAWVKLGAFVALELALLGWAALLAAIFGPVRQATSARGALRRVARADVPDARRAS
ncbi:hypothetical protein [Anaeromyxobacter oryzae]|uniref:Uncharacterized protein n=1 Tax=Anaeromyxobacter oryzae TaxID=2918170 RepID=A0ABN6MZM7_9BACT|nr:hypothetical protein [Anaeromyxobacter oryzae]BDG06422.1 hypothetical protein AMOR_54180 [Anaeromyxobacter oryzae]